MNYQIDLHDRRKRKIFHVNMLRKWHEISAMYAEAEILNLKTFEDLMSVRMEQ